MSKSKQVDLLKVATEQQATDIRESVASGTQGSEDAVFPEAFAASGPNTSLSSDTVVISEDS